MQGNNRKKKKKGREIMHGFYSGLTLAKIFNKIFHL
jgi:hypothetical protein